jgi:His/Glu/Gln/Arg/opine family amino acid ABC transporter permease subunit
VGQDYRFDWAVLWRYRGALLDGFQLTLALSALGLLAAIAIGLLVGTAAVSRRPGLRRAATGYVELCRNVPLLIHMYVWYLGLAWLKLPSFWCAVLALAIYSGAFVAEVVRSGIQSVPRGQAQAALASGLSPAQALRHVIYPQAMRIVAPSLAGIFSQLIKDSSLASVISVAELTFQAGAIEGETFRTFEAYVGITLLYLVTVTLVTRLAILVFGGRAGEVRP